MTQVGEMVSPALVLDDEIECPFEHELEKPPTVKNDLKGKGSTLGSRMKAKKGTHLYEVLKKGFAPTESVLNPKADKDHVFFQKKKVVKISVDRDEASDSDRTVKRSRVEHSYPVTCAAHHCIPAQESLKGHNILAFMCKKGSSEPANHDYGDGLVWSDVGYDVNGSQNGVYLPGSYAVGGGRGGMRVWAKDEPDKEDEDVVEAEADDSNQLTGALNDITSTSPKWLYVKEATRMAKAQFHDRHVDYSTVFIAGILDAMHKNYVHLYEGSFIGNDCAKCKKRADKLKDVGIPTPYSLVARLNKVSANCRDLYLTGPVWPRNVYTSMWGDAFMQAKLDGNADAD